LKPGATLDKSDIEEVASEINENFTSGLNAK